MAAFIIQNIYDAFDFTGIGVNGVLKLKSLQLETRGVALAESNDFLVINEICPDSFIKYLLNTTGVVNLTVMKYPVSSGVRTFLNSDIILDAVARDVHWPKLLNKNTEFKPYMKSRSIFRAARSHGLNISKDEWSCVVNKKIPERMNNKAELYRECSKLGIALPKHWFSNKNMLPKIVMELLRQNRSIYIRQSQNAGTFGNITVDVFRSQYSIREFGVEKVDRQQFMRLLNQYIHTGVCDEYIISELLDIQASPSTLFFVDKLGTRIVSHTMQILAQDSSYLGLTHPIIDRTALDHLTLIEKQTLLLTEPWRMLGYEGYGNIDWMITKDNRIFIAERNARQTASLLPLALAAKLWGQDMVNLNGMKSPHCLATTEVINLSHRVNFEMLHKILNKANLLLNSKNTGIIITRPPLPELGINTFGVLYITNNYEERIELNQRLLKTINH